MKKHQVTLTAEQRQSLLELIAAGKASAQRLTHARILLKADASQDGPAWTDEKIAEAVEVSIATVERVRQRFAREGLEVALERKKQQRPSRERKLHGVAEAQLLALACSEPPEGRANWTMQLLADKLVELQIVESICDESVRRTLKKREQAVPEGTRAHRSKRQSTVRPQPGVCVECRSRLLSSEQPGSPSRRAQPTTEQRDQSTDPFPNASAEAS
jgi:transposase